MACFVSDTATQSPNFQANKHRSIGAEVCCAMTYKCPIHIISNTYLTYPVMYTWHSWVPGSTSHVKLAAAEWVGVALLDAAIGEHMSLEHRHMSLCSTHKCTARGWLSVHRLWETNCKSALLENGSTKIANKAPDKMEERTEQDLWSPHRDPSFVKLCWCWQGVHLKCLTYPKWSYFLWGGGGVIQFFRAIRSLNFSLALRRPVFQIRVETLRHSPICKLLLFTWETNSSLQHQQRWTRCLLTQPCRGRDAALVCRCCWKVRHNCQKLWVIFFSGAFAWFSQFQNMLSALQPAGPNTEKINSLGSLRRVCWTQCLPQLISSARMAGRVCCMKALV